MNHAFFYKSVNGDRVYDDTSLEHWLKKFFTSGVFLNDLQVTANNDMTVNVGMGYANVDAKVKIFEADTTLQIETAGASYPRIDSIVIERNDTERDVFLKVIKGGYSSEPVAHVPVRQDGVYQLVIAQILVNAGAVKISQLDITDTRSDMELCGFVASTVDQIDFSQIQAQFDAYMEQYAEYIADYAEQMQADFDAWFQNVRNQLDEDAAGHLQNQIDDMKAEMELLGGSKVEVTMDSGEYNVVGLTVNLEIGGKTYAEVIPPEKKVVFTGVLETGTASITLVDAVQDIDTSASVEIPYYGAYKANLICINGYGAWLNKAGYTKEQYPTIADVLADEKAVRKLMTVHASCDAFVDWYNADNSMLSQFTANRVAMKWIGLRDYIADKLMSIPSALEQLLASEHWEYILKDKIPTMAGNAAPEGEVSSSSTFDNYYAFKAFDGVKDMGSIWHTAANAVTNAWLKYKFRNPFVAKKVYLNHNDLVALEKTNAVVRIQGSNDDSSWTNLTSDISITEVEKWVDLNNKNSYIYYRLFVVSCSYFVSGQNYYSINEFQLYGRSLNESGPIMTSNTAPLGEAFALTEYDATYAAHKSFDNNADTRWVVNNDGFTTAAGQYVGYKFVKPIRAKIMLVTPMANTSGQQLKSFVVKARNSDAEEWVNVSEEITLSNSTTSKEYSVDLTNEKHFKQFALYATSDSYHTTSPKTIGIVALNFYGVSYSEEEFGSDEIEMLYDYGVEVANITATKDDNSTVIKADDYVTGKTSASTKGSSGIVMNGVLPSGYKYMIGEYDERLVNSTTIFVAAASASTVINVNSNNATTNETLTKGKLVMDISAISKLENISFSQFNNNAFNVELAKLRKFYLIK